MDQNRLSFIQKLRHFHVRGVLTVICLVALLLTVTMGSKSAFAARGVAAVGTSCAITYTVSNQWPGSFIALLSITNTGSTPINGWTLQFTFSNGQNITSLFAGVYTQVGGLVTITNAIYNGQVAAGGQVNPAPGFIATWSGSNPNPTSFTLNGQLCS